MQTLPSPLAAVLDGGRFSVRTMLRLDLATGSTGMWSGDYTLIYGGVTYAALSGAMVPSPIPGALGLGSDALEITISGLDPAVTTIIATANWHQRPAVVSEVYLDDAGEVQHVRPVFAGFADTLDEVSADRGAMTAVLRIESNSRELTRSVGRVRSDADQRSVDPTDGFFRYVNAVTANPQIYWGRKGPQNPWG